MTDHLTWIHAVRASHDRLAALLTPLSAQQVAGPSYDNDWSIAQVASHLGSQSEIFALFLDAGTAGSEVPGMDAFREIWARWDAMPFAQQVEESNASNATFVDRLESLSNEQRDAFTVSMFGAERGLDGLCEMRLGEHAVHTWDIAVALDPAAKVAGDAVDLLVDTLVVRAGSVGKPVDGTGPVLISTTDPQRSFELQLSPGVSLRSLASMSEVDGVLTLSAEALVRLVYGRLDVDHTPVEVAGDDRLESLRQAFPGF